MTIPQHGRKPARAEASAGSGVASRMMANAYVLLTLTPLFWAGNFIVGKWVAGDVPPFALGTLRWVAAAAILAPFAWPHLRRDWPDVKRHLGIIALLGLLGPTLFNTIAYVGLNSTTALNGLIMQSAAPILIVTSSFLIFRDRLSVVQALGIATSMVGVIVVVTRGALGALLELALNIGDLIILAGFVSWSLYTVFLRYRPDAHWLTFAFLLAVAGVVFNVPLWAIEHVAYAPFTWSWKAIIAVLYVAIFPSIVSYNLYNRGVQLIGANRAGVFLHLVPLFGSVMAIGLLGERLETYHLLGFALIIVGVVLAARRA
ncbi:MAG: DMT family transporter [Pseudomonadota bacterium]